MYLYHDHDHNWLPSSTPTPSNLHTVADLSQHDHTLGRFSPYSVCYWRAGHRLVLAEPTRFPTALGPLFQRPWRLEKYK
jgi:hypothetical protein